MMMLGMSHAPTLCTLVIILSVQLATCSNIGATRQDITLSDDGGYGNILIAIDESVPEDPVLIEKLQNYFTQASGVLLVATNSQVYFNNFSILVPPSWTHNSSWQVPSAETVDVARVIIGPANLAWGDTPYTLQPGQCGQEGDYVLFTPQYLTNDTVRMQSKPEKRIVREFAHLKWGLFDEDVPVDYKYTSQFYSLDEGIIPTRCLDADLKIFGKTDGDCMYIVEEQRYTTCRYIPTDGSISASLMYAENLDSVVSFCSKSNSGTSTAHNNLAKNRQNKLCNEQSAWEVMLSLEDFAEDHFTNRNGVTPPSPTFRVIQHHEDEETISTTTSDPNGVTASLIVTSDQVECAQDVVCLALDVSGSMNGYGRLTKMANAVRTYISNYLRSDTVVGIVSFSTFPKILASMTKITSQLDKDYLLSAIPTTASGVTGIANGLNLCRYMLTAYSGDGVGDTRIVVLSDGEETEWLTTVNVVLPAIQQLGILVDAILYSQEADNVLINASSTTGGLWFAVSDNSTDEDLPLHLQKTVERQCSVVAVTVKSEKVNLPPNEDTVTGVAYFDATIGLNTTLLFTYKNDINVTLTVEGGNQVMISKDEAAKRITAVIEGKVTGEVMYTIIKIAPSPTVPEEIVVIVTSNPVSGVDQIRINTRTSGYDIQFNENTKLVLYVDIFQKYTPILDLTVTAVIETNTGSEKQLDCVDDGNGLDSTPNDGVYTTAFNSHDFTGNGYYSIKVLVDGEGRRPGEELSRRKRCTNCAEETLGRIVRTTSGGAVNVNNYVPVSDKTSPEKIKDLSVVAVSVNETAIYTFRWTAPGNDLNVGTVSGYSIAVSTDSTLNNLVVLPENHESILTNLSSLLVVAGSTLELQLDAGKFNNQLLGRDAGTSSSTYYIRISTADAEGNVAAYSNVAEATIVNTAALHLGGPTTTTTSTKRATTLTTATTIPTKTATTSTTTTTTPTTMTTIPTTTTTIPTTTITTPTTSTTTPTKTATTSTTTTTTLATAVQGVKTTRDSKFTGRKYALEVTEPSMSLMLGASVRTISFVAIFWSLYLSL